MNVWQDMARGTQLAAEPAAQGNGDAFAQWSRWFTGGTKQSETIDRLIDSAKSYTTFMQTMLAAMTGKGDGAMWTDALKQAFIPQIPGLLEHPLAQLWQSGKDGLTHSLGQLWQSGKDGFAQSLAQLWQTGQGSNSTITSGLIKTLNELGTWRAPPELVDIKGWLNLPTFGYPREHQERYQKAAAAWIDYQERMQRYQALMFRVAQRGFEIFEGKLTEREQPGRQIESLRALYDLWVDAVEEGHAEIALSDEFREVYGALVDAQMRVRAFTQQEVERLCANLGIPTRSEIGSIGERLQALRREVRANGTGGGGSSGDIAALRAEIDAMKDSLRAARTASSPSRSDPSGDIAALREEIQALKDALKSARTAAQVAQSDATTSRAAAPPRAQRARYAGAVTKSAAPAPKRPKKPQPKSARPGQDASAGSAANFASRIARFANASLGAAHQSEKRSGKLVRKKH
jgi:class III poly(R)-hydroxyalkanoic acid synthase PhaE subunit